jgi:heptosyltransferase-1
MPRNRNPIKTLTRAATIAGARLWLRPRERPLPPPEEVRRVLVLKMWAIGEYLMATPAFAALRARYPQARITFVGGLNVASLAAAAPFFDDVWSVPEEIFVNRRLGSMQALGRRVRGAAFEVAVVFHQAWEFTLFTAAARVPHRVGFDRAGDGFAHTVKVPYGVRTHQVEEYFDLARACGAGVEPGPMIVVPPVGAEEEAAALQREVPTLEPGEYILVGPGGGVNPKTRMEDKRWPADYYVDLIEDLKNAAPVILVGGASDADVNKHVAAAAAVPDLTGRTSLGALFLLLQNARTFIGNDSAPMHLAAAAGCPTVAFFGPTNPQLNGPWMTKGLILRKGEACSPCYADGYFPACADRRCLTGIRPESAAAEIHEFLDSLSRG